jgi:hypothetical protein
LSGFIAGLANLAAGTIPRRLAVTAANRPVTGK